MTLMTTQITNMITTLGFPIVAFLLMYRFATATIKENTVAIKELTIAITGLKR